MATKPNDLYNTGISGMIRVNDIKWIGEPYKQLTKSLVINRFS